MHTQKRIISAFMDLFAIVFCVVQKLYLNFYSSCKSKWSSEIIRDARTNRLAVQMITNWLSTPAETGIYL